MVENVVREEEIGSGRCVRTCVRTVLRGGHSIEAFWREIGRRVSDW